jgi:predicted DNA-binding protein
MAGIQQRRMALTLPPALEVALQGLSEAMGKPMATLTVEMLVEMIPQLEGLTKFTLAAKAGNKAATKRALVHMLGDNMAEMMAMQQPELFKTKSERK